jgi:hypothetical protein
MRWKRTGGTGQGKKSESVSRRCPTRGRKKERLQQTTKRTHQTRSNQDDIADETDGHEAKVVNTCREKGMESGQILDGTQIASTQY